MTFDPALEGLFEDTITLELFTSETAARVQSFGAPTTYKALIQRGARRTIGRDGRDVISNVQVYVPNRLAIDVRSRVTLPTDFDPQQPPIMGVEPLKGQGMDHTAIYL